MELEVWPNFTQIAARNSAAVVVVNGRISDRSFPRYKLIKPAIRWMFNKIDLVLAQTAEYGKRFVELGCSRDKVIVTSSLKYDTAEITDRVPGTDELAGLLNIGDERIWVAGGTGPGEEKILLDTFAKLKADKRFEDLRLAMVPRKPERFDETAELIEQQGFEYIRYSMIKNNQKPADSKPAVILGDTMGDLRKFYSLATVVFVGRSLVPMGGSDMMEPAALGKCTIFGKHTFNFKQTVDALLAGDGAIEVENESKLLTTVKKCLDDTRYSESIAARGREVIRQNQGATDKTVEAIIALLNS